MRFIDFHDWFMARESSPFTRLRSASAHGLMPPIPKSSLNSHSTASPFEQKSKKKKKKKRKLKNKKRKSSTNNPVIDSFIKSVEDLKKDLEMLQKSKIKKATNTLKSDASSQKVEKDQIPAKKSNKK